ncbi:MAG: hypothetical protein IJ497_00300 [Clostridia bacterium]|nr:hypothetical protein [Clostridia bacterium]
MKKLTAILIALALVSCTKNTDIAAGLETYREVYDTQTETEVPYSPPEEGVSVNGIFSDLHVIRDGKYYFETRRRAAPDSDNYVTMLAYADLENGTCGIVCPDPLCTHEEDECPYAQLRECYFSDDPGVYYAYTFGHPASRIWKVDMNRGTVETVYSMETTSGFIIGYDGGRLYFYERIELTENRKTVKKIRLSYLDHASQEVVRIGYVPDGYGGAFQFVIDGEIYFTMNSGRTLMKTDPEYRNVTLAAELEASASKWYFDPETDEFFYVHRDYDNFKGSFHVAKDGVSKQIHLPHEDVYSFILTEDKIYYTVFDPVYYGTSSLAAYFDVSGEETKTYDYTGGKMYAVSRENPSGEAELVYEVSVSEQDRVAMLAESIVVGDYLYYTEAYVWRQVIDGVEYVTFSEHEEGKVRVGLEDGSVMRIAFE